MPHPWKRRLRLAAVVLSIAVSSGACGGSTVDAPPADDAGTSSGGVPPPRLPIVGTPLRPTTPPWDIGSTAATLGAWPLLAPGIHTRALTSFDRGGGNDDGFGGTYS